MVGCHFQADDMFGLNMKAMLLTLLLPSGALAQHFHHASIFFDSSTPGQGLSEATLYYMSPIISVVVLFICLFCLNHLIQQCRAKRKRGNPTVPTISGSIQNAIHSEPPPPYTFTDIYYDGSFTEGSLPTYEKDPPAYLELKNVSTSNS